MTLAERFERDGGAPQEVEGVLVHGMYRRSVADGARVRLRRRHAIATPVQGIRLKLDKGKLVVNGQDLGDVVLWADTAPEDVELICKTGKIRRLNCAFGTAGETTTV